MRLLSVLLLSGCLSLLSAEGKKAAAPAAKPAAGKKMAVFAYFNMQASLFTFRAGQTGVDAHTFDAQHAFFSDGELFGKWAVKGVEYLQGGHLRGFHAVQIIFQSRCKFDIENIGKILNQ